MELGGALIVVEAWSAMTGETREGTATGAEDAIALEAEDCPGTTLQLNVVLGVVVGKGAAVL